MTFSEKMKHLAKWMKDPSNGKINLKAFEETEKKFMDSVSRLRLLNKELNAENQWLESKDIEVVNFYIQIVNFEDQNDLDEEHRKRVEEIGPIYLDDDE